MFGDIDIRSRLNRMGHPFDWGARKRRGSAGFPAAAATNENPAAATTANDPYSQYFDADFPHFGSPQFSSAFGGRKRGGQSETQNDRGRFFDYLPPEFRQYFPDSFGLNQMRNQMPQQAAASPPTQQYVPQHQYAQTPPQQQYVQPPQQQQYGQPPQQQQYVQPPLQQQQQQQYAQVPFQQQQTQPQFYNTSIPVYQEPPRPKVCDASIQTECVSEELNQGSGGLQQHGLRNTVDMGQKSQQEEVRQDRAQSAPPPTDFVPNLASSFVSANDGPNYVTTGSFANTGTSMTPQAQGHKQFNYQNPNPSQPTTPQDSGVARTIPIFVEGRNIPTVPKNNEPNVQQTSQPTQQQQHASKQQQHRPQPFTPIDTTDSSSDPSSNNPPQTPHTSDCIQKIQNIQRDVLDLMSKVDKFQGIRGDKEYAYIDEMLTRNLLKLDTIDTNGRDSIRLARKEAIRCIQASITVLEAKAENNTKSAANDPNNSCSSAKEQSKNVPSQDSGVVENAAKENSTEKNTVASEPATDEIPRVAATVDQGQEATASQ